MEGKNKKEEMAAPDSWETADLDESMNRLFIASRKTGSPAPELDTAAAVAEAPPPPAAAGDGSLEEAISQVDQFLREALEKPRERISVLRMEQDIEKFIRSPTQQQLEFNSLPTSYLRLAAHRLAQHYSLQSTAIADPTLPDGSGSRIILRKTSADCKLPLIRLADIPVNLPQEATGLTAVKVAIKQRTQKHSQSSGNQSFHSSRGNQQKSVEERKEEYNRARARIFNSSNNNNSSSSSSSTVVKVVCDEPRLPDTLDNCSFLDPNPTDKGFFEGSEIGRDFNLNSSSSSYSNSGSNRLNRTKSEKDIGITRQRSGGRVAIFRDREVDRKDPDYDRSYDRYMQRFDPGFGFNGGTTYTMQPLYAPVVNYNTEFPQLGTNQRPPPQLQISQQQQQQGQPIPSPHMHPGGPWSSVAQGPGIAYRPTPDGMMAVPTFNMSSPIGVPAGRSPIYMQPSQSQYSFTSRPTVPFVSPIDHIQQPFVQAQQQQQAEGSYGMARPR